MFKFHKFIDINLNPLFMKTKLLIYSILIIFFAAFVIVFTSCKKEDVDELDLIPLGLIKGIVLSENNHPIPAVNVFVLHEEDVYITKTGYDGKFSLVAPAGEQTLHIQSGKGNIFRSFFSVTIVQDAVTEVYDMNLKLIQVANLAYVKGAYDAIEDIIIDDLGYSASMLELSDLNDYSNLQEYAAIFLNCGFQQSGLNENIWNNLEDFVLAGGSLYVSDWAVNSLIGVHSYNKDLNRTQAGMSDLQIKSCPERPGGFIPWEQLCTRRIGAATTIINASVINSDIATLLQSNTIDIEYDLGSWEVIENMGNIWEVLIEDQSEGGYGPLAIRTYMTSGLNLNNKNNHQTWMTICHYPPGNPENAQTITIPISAWPAHEAHGDDIGPCETQMGGSIIFTTFHNHPGGHETCPNIQKILQYFIMNL